jgi:hypothetical protein
MTFRILLLAAAAAVLAAQTRMSVDQLRSFLKSSVDLHQPDKQVAEYLKKSKLTQRLSAREFEEFIAMGVGAKTLEILREWLTATKELPAAPAPAAIVKAVPKPIPPPSEAEQKKILAEATEYALSYSKRLPDFFCVQVTRRYIDPSGLEFWRNTDTITTRLSYFDKKEEYKVISINGRMTDVAYQRLDGSTSSGEFGTMMRELFERETAARFEWERWATLRGKRMHVFSYYVAQPNSKWTVSYNRSEVVTPGYRGTVFVDRETSQITRITLEGDMPPSVPVQGAKTVLDYDYTDISGSPFLVPLRAEVRMRAGKELVKNEVEFRLYRKFGTDVGIKFDILEPLPEEQTKEQPPKQ